MITKEMKQQIIKDYQLKEGDRVEWVYTCDLGSDVGGKDSARNGR